MRRVIPFIYVCLFLLTTTAPAFAQQRLLAFAPLEIIELDARLSSLGTVVRRLPVSEADGSSRDVASDSLTDPGGVIFGGSAFIASASGGINLVDTRTGRLQRFMFPDFTATRVLGTDGNARLLVLGTSESQRHKLLVADAHSGATRLLDLGPVGTVGRTAYAMTSDLLFVARPRNMTVFGGYNFFDIDVVHVATGALLKRIDISPADASWSLATNSTGTRLFVTVFDKGTAVFDVASGTVTAASTATSLARGTPILDEVRNRLVVNYLGVETFSADSLQSLGKATLPELPLPQPAPPETATLTTDLDVSGQSATMFMLQGVKVGYNYYPHRCPESQLIAIDADTGRARRTADTTAALGEAACWTTLFRLTEPAPPPALTADVTGHRVTLTWQAPFGATHYEVEAGSAAGLANLATVRVSDTELAVEGVPTGTYYLRVRAINTIGKSAPSQEIRLVVQ